MKRLSLVIALFIVPAFIGCELGMTDYYDDLTQPGTFTVTYDGNGAEAGNGLPPTDDYEYREGDTVYVKGNEGDLKHGTDNFCGWNYESATGHTYTKGQFFSMGRKPVTLYANWKAGTVHHVFYAANGGSGTPPKDETGYFSGDPVSMPNQGNLTMTGYTFGGWRETTDNSGILYPVNKTYTMGGTDVTLYAYWFSNNTYSVFYSPGDPEPGTSYTGSEPGEKSYNYNDPVTVSSSTLAHIHYNLDGWNYNDGATIHQLVPGDTFTMPNKTVVLSARWSPKTCTVTFSAQGGGTPNPQTKLVTYNSNYGALASSSRSGYNFLGWYTGTSGSGSRIETSTIVKTVPTQTLYANWSAITSTVTFDYQGGSGATANKTVTYNSTYGTLPTPTTRIGYSFGGWYTATGGTGTRITSTTTVTITSNQTLYAYWPDQYSVGSTGPAGGTIFYLNPNFATDGWRYLEASSLILVGAPWSPSETATTGADGTAIGTGWQNTIDIVNQYGSGSQYAAYYCSQYDSGGYQDWFLPSRLELNEMINTIWQSLRTGCCNIVWTSTESSAQDAVIFYEVDENPVFGHESKTSTYNTKFRPIRRF